MPISWLQISVVTSHTQLAEAVFERFEAEAITDIDLGDTLIAEEQPNSQPALERARVIGLFEHGTPVGPIRTALIEALGDRTQVDVQTLENQNWASAWLAKHPPMIFGDRLWIAPHSASVNASDGDIIVRLDPGLAFGTGTHPTTSLCLHWLATQDMTGKRVLDYGCGSGILSIAAAMLGAVAVTAVDIDEQAITATRENAGLNQVSDLVATPPRDGIDNGPFDIVLANILAKPLIELAPILATLTAPGAPVILSGLLTRQINEVVAAYETDFEFEPPALEEDWARLVGWRKDG